MNVKLSQRFIFSRAKGSLHDFQKCLEINHLLRKCICDLGLERRIMLCEKQLGVRKVVDFDLNRIGNSVALYLCE